MPKLSNNEKSPYTDVIRLTAADIAANSAAITGGTYRIATVPASGCVTLTVISRPVAFNAEVTAAAATIGITSGTATSLISTAAIGSTTAAIAPIGTHSLSNYAAETPIFLKIVFTGGPPTAGEVVIGMIIHDNAQYIN
jgi:hypothetical protein